MRSDFDTKTTQNKHVENQQKSAKTKGTNTRGRLEGALKRGWGVRFVVCIECPVHSLT